MMTDRETKSTCFLTDFITRCFAISDPALVIVVDMTSAAAIYVTNTTSSLVSVMSIYYLYQSLGGLFFNLYQKLVY